MEKRRKKLLWCVIALLVAGAVGWLILGGKSSGAAEKYKAELRAEGEKLTYVELGFPKPPEAGSGLLRLNNAVTRLTQQAMQPYISTDDSMPRPGYVMISWRGDAFVLDPPSNQRAWTEYNSLVQQATNELAEIRAAAALPVQLIFPDPANWPTNVSLPLRSGAHWLYCDGIEAMHAGDLRRARLDLHALVQLTEFGRNDMDLSLTMIRVEIAGLGIQFNWQALQHPDWTEADLAAMQRDWERVDLLGALEQGCIGERASTIQIFSTTRKEGPRWFMDVKRQVIAVRSPGRTPGWWDEVKDRSLWLFWDSDDDEQLALRLNQADLESVRLLRGGTALPVAIHKNQSEKSALREQIDDAKGLVRFRYQFSTTIFPSAIKAIQVTVRNETQRRLTVSAIALRRFHLRHRHWPVKLEELVPEFLASVPIDPMSAEPLGYRREADGGFILYSIGEDGRDNGGDPTPPNNLSKAEPWNGLDFVWPKPAD